MVRSSLYFFIICCLASKPDQAQNAIVKMDSLFIGTWKGTSLCQVKNSPCHDEIVVYHISKNKDVDTFFINASKMVNGAEEEMGILPFVYNKKKNQFISTAYGLWTFNIDGDKLEGTLLVRGVLYRKIKLTKHF